jgi:hypothetical protein
LSVGSRWPPPCAQPKEAIGAFEELYRVDRDWPRLSDWLLRSHAAQRRQEEKGDSADSPSGRAGRRMPSYAGSSGTSPGGRSSGGDGGSAAPAMADEASIATESDHYVVLGVTCDATDKQIQQAYRMRSLRYHPDRKGGSTAAFQRIAQAFQTLSDVDKRANYDQGVDIKTKRGGGDSDDSEEEDEERRQSLREEIERRYYPERYDFWPFGARAGRRACLACVAHAAAHAARGASADAACRACARPTRSTTRAPTGCACCSRPPGVLAACAGGAWSHQPVGAQALRPWLQPRLGTHQCERRRAPKRKPPTGRARRCVPG